MLSYTFAKTFAYICHRQIRRGILKKLRDNINIRNSMLTALGNAAPSHLLDHQLFDFKKLKAATGDVESELDLSLGHTREDLQPALVSIITS